MLRRHQPEWTGLWGRYGLVTVGRPHGRCKPAGAISWVESRGAMRLYRASGFCGIGLPDFSPRFFSELSALRRRMMDGKPGCRETQAQSLGFARMLALDGHFTALHARTHLWPGPPGRI